MQETTSQGFVILDETNDQRTMFESFNDNMRKIDEVHSELAESVVRKDPATGKVPDEMLPELELTWGNVENKPAQFPPAQHQHSISEITDLPPIPEQGYVKPIDGIPLSDLNSKIISGLELAHTAVQLDNTGKIAEELLPSLGITEVSWGDITDKPTMFTPTSHTHMLAEIADFEAIDFATAEQGAKADAAYQKPADGIPKSDLSLDVRDSLEMLENGYFARADSVYEKPADGIPKSDLSLEVRDSLDKADTALQDGHQFATAEQGQKADSAIQEEIDPIYMADKPNIALHTDISAAKESVMAEVQRELTDYLTEEETRFLMQEVTLGVFKKGGKVNLFEELPISESDFVVYYVAEESRPYYSFNGQNGLIWVAFSPYVDLSLYETVAGATEKMSAATNSANAYINERIGDIPVSAMPRPLVADAKATIYVNMDHIAMAIHNLYAQYGVPPTASAETPIAMLRIQNEYEGKGLNSILSVFVGMNDGTVYLKIEDKYVFKRNEQYAMEWYYVNTQTGRITYPDLSKYYVAHWFATEIESFFMGVLALDSFISPLTVSSFLESKIAQLQAQIKALESRIDNLGSGNGGSTDENSFDASVTLHFERSEESFEANATVFSATAFVNNGSDVTLYSSNYTYDAGGLTKDVLSTFVQLFVVSAEYTHLNVQDLSVMFSYIYDLGLSALDVDIAEVGVLIELRNIKTEINNNEYTTTLNATMYADGEQFMNVDYELITHITGYPPEGFDASLRELTIIISGHDVIEQSMAVSTFSLQNFLKSGLLLKGQLPIKIETKSNDKEE